MIASLLQSSVAFAPDADAGAQFAAGYYFGCYYQNEGDYLKKCFKNDTVLNSALEDAFDYIWKGDTDGAAKEFKKAQGLFETDMAECKDIAYDFKHLMKYADDVLSKPDAKEVIAANIKKQQARFDGVSKLALSLWTTRKWMDAGQFSAWTMQSMGLAPD